LALPGMASNTRELGGFGVTGSNQSIADLKRLVDGAVRRWGRKRGKGR
jgi:hypothetical protein